MNTLTAGQCRLVGELKNGHRLLAPGRSQARYSLIKVAPDYGPRFVRFVGLSTVMALHGIGLLDYRGSVAVLKDGHDSAAEAGALS